MWVVVSRSLGVNPPVCGNSSATLTLSCTTAYPEVASRLSWTAETHGMEEAETQKHIHVKVSQKRTVEGQQRCQDG